MIDPAVFVRNVNILLNIEEKTVLTVDEDGVLQTKASQENIHTGFFANLFRPNAASSTEKVINDTCQRLFDEIIKNNTDPLISTSAALTKDRVKAGQILDRLDKIGREVLNPQLKADLQELVDAPETLEARLALRQGITPKVLNQTISGTYIMHNRQGNPWGIFKPQCQEVGGSKNPSWLVWAAFSAEQWGIESGTGYLRECAAYCMDKNQFSNVPLTLPTKFQHTVLDTSLFPIGTPDMKGSFQLFKDNCKPGIESLNKYEYSPLQWNKPIQSMLSSIAKKVYVEFYRFLFFCGLPHIPANQIHRMAILDIRILNCDRHLGNFLFDKLSKKLYPIDHGLILPAKASRLRFDWKQLVQAHIPFSHEELAYIENLDAEEDEKTLRKCGISSSEALERMKLSTTLLKECARRGLTAFQIADLMLGKWGTAEDRYFENVICRKIFKRGEKPESVIDRAIIDYIRT